MVPERNRLETTPHEPKPHEPEPFQNRIRIGTEQAAGWVDGRVEVRAGWCGSEVDGERIGEKGEAEVGRVGIGAGRSIGEWGDKVSHRAPATIRCGTGIRCRGVRSATNKKKAIVRIHNACASFVKMFL